MTPCRAYLFSLALALSLQGMDARAQEEPEERPLLPEAEETQPTPEEAVAPEPSPPVLDEVDEEEETHGVDEQRILAALVEVRTTGFQRQGFLVGDRRTVVVSCLTDRFRRVTVRMSGAEGDEEVRVAEVQATTAEQEAHSETYQALAVLTLEEDLPGTPLPISNAAPALGETLWFISRPDDVDARGDPSPESIEIGSATITAVTGSSLSVGLSSRQRWDGTPLLDRSGAVVAFLGTGGRAPRVGRVLNREALEPRQQLARFLFGLRIGTAIGQFDSASLAIDLELGVNLWDQFGIVFRVGATVGSSFFQTLPGSDDHGPGVVQSSSSALHLGLELRYRLLLFRSSWPVSLNFEVGL